MEKKFIVTKSQLRRIILKNKPQTTVKKSLSDIESKLEINKYKEKATPLDLNWSFDSKNVPALEIFVGKYLQPEIGWTKLFAPISSIIESKTKLKLKEVFYNDDRNRVYIEFMPISTSKKLKNLWADQYKSYSATDANLDTIIAKVRDFIDNIDNIGGTLDKADLGVEKLATLLKVNNVVKIFSLLKNSKNVPNELKNASIKEITTKMQPLELAKKTGTITKDQQQLLLKYKKLFNYVKDQVNAV